MTLDAPALRMVVVQPCTTDLSTAQLDAESIGSLKGL